MTDSLDVPNVLTFDLEHWYTATLVRDSVSDPTDRIESSVERVLALLDEHDVSATFFVVGEVAEEYPGLIAQVTDRGHELATHGHTHTPLFDLDRETFAAELDKSRRAIEQAAGVTVEGFRAPNFSVTPETAWALDVLDETGFAYDSSVFPVRTPMYGVSEAPTGPYRVRPSAPFTDGGGDDGLLEGPSSCWRPTTGCFTDGGGDDGLLEVPLAVHPRFKIPVAGGFYARLLPVQVLTWGIDALNARDQSAVLYFHPWEFNLAVQTSDPPLHARAVSYYGIDKTADVLERLFKQYTFDTVSESLLFTQEKKGSTE